MSSNHPQTIPTPESVHDAWLSQRSELEHDLFDGWTPEVRSSAPTVTSTPVAEATRVRLDEPAPAIHKPHVADQKKSVDQARHEEWLKQSNAAAVQQRVQHQQRVSETLTQQRETFFQDLAQQRAALEQELSGREAAWVTQRDQEWAALQSAKDVHEVAHQRLKDELSVQRVREREELLQWRRQAEAELAEARRLFEQERLTQQQELSRQRETEMSRLRHDREELDSRTRQVHSELAYSRQRQEEELRQIRDVQLAQMRTERAELDKLRDTWLDKFRREQIVLENGLRFFGDHLSRVSEELQVAQRGLQAVSESATEANPNAMFVNARQVVESSRSTTPTVLSLDEIRERLNDIRRPQRAVA